jgi:hypothetical protein
MSITRTPDLANRACVWTGFSKGACAAKATEAPTDKAAAKAQEIHVFFISGSESENNEAVILQRNLNNSNYFIFISLYKKVINKLNEGKI